MARQVTLYSTFTKKTKKNTIIVGMSSNIYIFESLTCFTVRIYIP